MLTLKSHLAGQWVPPGKVRTLLLNPATEEPLAEIGTADTDFRDALAFARSRGGAALKELSFRERGELLRSLARLIHGNRDELIGIAIKNGGNTRGDAKFDIDGASATLTAYAELGHSLGAERLLVEGEGIQLGRSARFHGLHVWVPRDGVAVHINAFNFPAWGFAEKAAQALLAGMPVVTKPATATAWVAHRIFELVVQEKVLPPGALSLVAGGVGDLVSHLTGQDVLAFTGASATGTSFRVLGSLARSSVRINVEADSLNAAVLGPDAGRGEAAYEMFLADAVKEMTQKTGQKCTATRRILVPRDRLDEVSEDLADRLSRVRTGNPAEPEVTMGPVATADQLADVREGIRALGAEADSVFGGLGEVSPVGAPAGKGYYVGPVLFKAREPEKADVVHAREVFGPVATLLAYDGSAASAATLVLRGLGSLVSSVYGDDRDFLRELTLGIAAWNGRILLASGKLSGQSTPPGVVLPQLVHGGPGRAGGGEELGGARGLTLYMQRTAIQGDRPILQGVFGGARFPAG